MAGKLIRVVHMQDERGDPHTFRPGDDVPAWAQRRITNPACWDDSGKGVTASPSRPSTMVSPAVRTEGAPPPQSGKGSGVTAWENYAKAKGVTLPAEVDERDEIIAHLRAAGVPVE